METLEYLTIEDLKRQCRVDFEDDDELLSLYGSAAERAVVAATRRSAEELAAMGGGTMPVALRLAMLLLAAHYYRLREAVTGVGQEGVPYAYEYLVKPYVRLSGTDADTSWVGPALAKDIAPYFDHPGCLVEVGGNAAALPVADAELLRPRYEAFLTSPTLSGLSELGEAVAARLVLPEAALWELYDEEGGTRLSSGEYLKAADGTISGALSEGTGAAAVWSVSGSGGGYRFTNANTGLCLCLSGGAATLAAAGEAGTDVRFGTDGAGISCGGTVRVARMVSAIEKTIGDAGMATCRYPFAVRLPEGLSAYAATDAGDSVDTTPAGTDALPAGVAVVLEGAGGTYALELLPDGAPALTVENGMDGTYCKEVIADGREVYVLSVVGGAPQFARLADGSAEDRTLAANTGYLPATGGAEEEGGAP